MEVRAFDCRQRRDVVGIVELAKVVGGHECSATAANLEHLSRRRGR